MCIDDSGRILIARRNPSRHLYPGLYEGCGGQLARGEGFADGVRRHYRLEMGLDVSVDTTILRFYEIRLTDGSLIPGIRFLCHRLGNAEVRSSNHDEIRWVFEAELRGMEEGLLIPGLGVDFLLLFDQYWRRAASCRPFGASS